MMSTKRNRRHVPRQPRGSLLAELRKTLAQHFRAHVAWYLPALTPVVLFLLAHLLTLLAFFLTKSGEAYQDQELHKTMVTWAVYGFLPLLLSSYLCFFVVARPAIGVLARKFPLWTDAALHLSAGGAYGLAIGLSLFLLLMPATLLNALLILLIGLAVGQGNWFVYRRLVAIEFVRETHPLEEQPE
jgi:hypothetical protein